MLQGLAIAVVVLGLLIVALSVGCLRLWNRADKAAEDIEQLRGFVKRQLGQFAGLGIRVAVVEGFIPNHGRRLDAIEPEVVRLKDVTDGMARQVVDEYLSKLSANAAGVEAGIDTKVFGD